jgi:hypothetical protein
MRIGLAAVDGCFGIGVMSVLDLLQTADALRARVDPAIPAIDVRVVGVTPRVATGSGMVLVADAGLGDLPTFDVIVACAMTTFTTDDTLAALSRPDVRRLVGALTELRRHIAIDRRAQHVFHLEAGREPVQIEKLTVDGDARDEVRRALQHQREAAHFVFERANSVVLRVGHRGRDLAEYRP